MRLRHRRHPPGAQPLCIVMNAILLRRTIELAEQSLPVETGGILIGYRTHTSIVVADALEVPDLQSTSMSYRRDQGLAQRLLEDRLSDEPASSYLGFVGDWHSHTGDAGASTVDLTTLRENAFSDGDSLALIVVMQLPTGWKETGYVTSRLELRRPPRSRRQPRVFNAPIVTPGRREWICFRHLRA